MLRKKEESCFKIIKFKIFFCENFDNVVLTHEKIHKINYLYVYLEVSEVKDTASLSELSVSRETAKALFNLVN